MLSPSALDAKIPDQDSLDLIKSISDCFPDHTADMIEGDFLESVALCMNMRAFDPKTSDVVLKATECCFKAVSSISNPDHFVKVFENHTVMKAVKRLADARGFKKAHNDVMDKSRIPIPEPIHALARQTLKKLTAGLEQKLEVELKNKENVAPESATAEASTEQPEILTKAEKNPEKFLKDTRRQSRIFKAGGRNIKKKERSSKSRSKKEASLTENPKQAEPAIQIETLEENFEKLSMVEKLQKQSESDTQPAKPKKKSVSLFAQFLIDGLSEETSQECEEAFLTLRGKGMISLHFDVERSIAVVGYKEHKLSVKDLANALKQNSSLKVQGQIINLKDKSGQNQKMTKNGKTVTRQKYVDYFYSDEENLNGKTTTDQERGFLDSEELHFDVLENEDGQVMNDRPWRLWGEGGMLEGLHDLWQRNFYW